MDMIGSDKSLQDHWLKRFIACIIDAVIVWVIALVLWALLVLFTPMRWFGWHFWGMEPFLDGAIYWLYSSLMEGASGATIGKRLLSLRVSALQGDLDIGKTVVRNISKIHPLFLLLDLIIGLITEGDPKQRYMDRIAGTTVRAVTPAPAAPYQSSMPPPPSIPPAGAPEPYRYDLSTSYEYQAPKPKPQVCSECSGRLILTGSGRQQCIRCGKVY